MASPTAGSTYMKYGRSIKCLNHGLGGSWSNEVYKMTGIIIIIIITIIVFIIVIIISSSSSSNGSSVLLILILS